MVGLDLTEAEFDLVNARVTEAIKADGAICDSYADKNCPTQKGYWLQIVSGFEKYFSVEEIADVVPYIAKEEETIEL
jgi:hypothetical protein